jgi:hypothetical protein
MYISSEKISVVDDDSQVKVFFIKLIVSTILLLYSSSRLWSCSCLPTERRISYLAVRMRKFPAKNNCTAHVLWLPFFEDLNEQKLKQLLIRSQIRTFKD